MNWDKLGSPILLHTSIFLFVPWLLSRGCRCYIRNQGRILPVPWLEDQHSPGNSFSLSCDLQKWFTYSRGKSIIFYKSVRFNALMCICSSSDTQTKCKTMLIEISNFYFFTNLYLLTFFCLQIFVYTHYFKFLTSFSLSVLSAI